MSHYELGRWDFSSQGVECSLRRHARGFWLTCAGLNDTDFAYEDLDRIRLTRRWFSTKVVIDVAHQAEPLQASVGWRRGADLRRAYSETTEHARLYLAHVGEIRRASAWRTLVLDTKRDHLKRAVWLPHDLMSKLKEARPAAELWKPIPLQVPLTRDELEALQFLDVDIERLVADVNQQVLEINKRRLKTFFDTIERSPLTEEQRKAVICVDNRVLVVAAAGSGKTSVMVARAAYVAKKKIARPSRILLLAFNKAAAEELKERISDRFAAAGMKAAGIEARTFHSFGLALIGHATGRKPRPAPWLESGADTPVIVKLVDRLRDTSPVFRYEWDLYRLIYARASDAIEGGEPDDYDRETQRTGFRTLAGDTVRSEGERMIADFMFVSGVDCQYEKPYTYDVSDATHSQYHPDFYYPEIDVWHEHWALDRDGRAPKSFRGYADGITWKRQVHSENHTTLIETTWAGIMDPDGLVQLQQELEDRGLDFDWNPERVSDRGVVPHEQLASLIRAFMAHVKSNSLDREAVAQRLHAHPRMNTPRTQLFLRIYWQIHAEWNKALTQGGYVDFEDMLVHAAELLESGTATSEFDMVMVDEFQDASHARARLARALVDGPDKYLLAVGDDWQSINRFAGADISVMTDFHERFGRGPTLHLSKTFRCSQEICDLSSEFISQNPRQIRKEVQSTHGRSGVPVKLQYVDSRDQLAPAIKNYAEQLAAGSDGAAVTLNVLGRYNRNREFMPRATAGVDMTFRTVHGSKGLEADYVVLPNVGRGRLGFPSGMVDDPVLDLAMTEPDPFPHAEERRLFYVALTRARRGVLLLAIRGYESPFLVELLERGAISVEGTDARTGAAPMICPECRKGTLVERIGRYGSFLGCSRFPSCRGTRQTDVTGPDTYRTPRF